MLAGYAYGDLSGWLFAANVPQPIVEAPLWQSLYAWAALGAAATPVVPDAGLAFGRNVTDAASCLLSARLRSAPVSACRMITFGYLSST